MTLLCNYRIPGRRLSEATHVITGLGPHFWPQEDPVWGSDYNKAPSSTTVIQTNKKLSLTKIDLNDYVLNFTVVTKK